MKLADILQLATEMAGCREVPEDSAVHLEAGHDVRRVLFGIDIDLPELQLARQHGFDAVIAHHPIGGSTRLEFSTLVRRRQREMMMAEGISETVAAVAIEER